MAGAIKSFRDLLVWREGIGLVKNIYEATASFPDNERFGLISQLRRAAVSIPSNIAEGHIRGHKTEFRQFLFFALGSVAELETQLIIAKELGYLREEAFENLVGKIHPLGKRIRTLISKLTPNP
jgi:four helix bundle protein